MRQYSFSFFFRHWFTVFSLPVLSINPWQHYQKFIPQAEQLLMSIEHAMRSEPALEQTVRQFEAQKVCYLPFYVFLLRPMHRLLQYRVALERLMRQYGETHPDAPACRIFHARLLDLIQSQWEAYKRLENTYKLLEIQRDLIGLSPFPVNPTETLDGVDAKSVGQTTVVSVKPSISTLCIGPLPRPGRQFIREGWLQKLSKSGYQPRMFFLFSDQLVYASRTSAPFLQFKVHGQFPLYDLMVEEAEPAHSFTVFSGNLCFLVAAPSDWQRDRWLEDISRAILAAKTKPSSGSENIKGVGLALDGTRHMKSAQLASVSPTEQSQMLQRATTSVHVCWHRSFTYSMQDILRANEYETSGYLLRKFKNSNGWQRLWVVFTQNCLFFYKSYRDERPLASLPLLGYTITTPDSEHDQIRQDGVIKLQFKNHVYFFRGESHHTFARWFEHLSNAAGMSRRPKV
ncbi:FERM RhoGEF and pleckstrin domain protein 2 [Paragonimus heterotremus]|uniref:FERM RhoGEF and pleckstrin domain protein 2 n=1 Tax=Paragonimus heterotremus TaxID=100268 RepID=A0A8J4T7F3_9TREM|nr:FERM RhoGEF and pleckstrin domain protein 2 [Paragonimus heterotremus]